MGDTYTVYAPDGSKVSTVTKRAQGVSIMEIFRAGKSPIKITKRPGENPVAEADERRFQLPASYGDFFTYPTASVAAGTFSYLDARAPSGIPLMNAALSAEIGRSSQMAAPSLGILTTLYDYAIQASEYDACVAGISGATGTSVGTVAGYGTFAATKIPWLSAVVGTGSTWAGGWVGKQLGEVVCER